MLMVASTERYSGTKRKVMRILLNGEQVRRGSDYDNV